jgi:hypothetical protein
MSVMSVLSVSLRRHAWKFPSHILVWTRSGQRPNKTDITDITDIAVSPSLGGGALRTSRCGGANVPTWVGMVEPHKRRNIPRRAHGLPSPAEAAPRQPLCKTNHGIMMNGEM